MNAKLIGLSLGMLGLGACVAPMGAWHDNGSPSSPYGIPTASKPSGLPSSGGQPLPSEDSIYAWDGGVVDAQKPGSVEEGTPSHDVQPTEGGRMYILELYQEAIDERDALQLEVTALNASLEQAQNSIDDFVKRLARADAIAGSMTTERDRLRQENADLAARVVTAQIRRLEAEKILLESKLEWFRETEPEKSVELPPVSPLLPPLSNGTAPKSMFDSSAHDPSTHDAGALPSETVENEDTEG